jgi:hypothetical protein
MIKQRWLMVTAITAVTRVDIPFAIKCLLISLHFALTM